MMVLLCVLAPPFVLTAADMINGHGCYLVPHGYGL